MQLEFSLTKVFYKFTSMVTFMTAIPNQEGNLLYSNSRVNLFEKSPHKPTVMLNQVVGLSVAKSSWLTKLDVKN